MMTLKEAWFSETEMPWCFVKNPSDVLHKTSGNSWFTRSSLLGCVSTCFTESCLDYSLLKMVFYDFTLKTKIISQRHLENGGFHQNPSFVDSIFLGIFSE